MKSNRPTSAVKIVCAVALLTIVAGCAGAGEPLNYVAADDIPPGPGMVTGDKGHFAITFWNGGKEDDEGQRRPAEQVHGLTRTVTVPARSARDPVLPPDRMIPRYQPPPVYSTPAPPSPPVVDRRRPMAPSPARRQSRKLVADIATEE